ncbi:MAG: thioredoxin family protein [Polyangiaceae bacterium]
MDSLDLDTPRNSQRADGIRTLTSSAFTAQVLEADGPVVVEFMSYGCAYCRELEPVLQQVAQMVSATEKVFRVNIAVDEALAADYGVDGTPTLVMFLNGQEVGRAAGPHPTVASLLSTVTEPFES